jgi:thioesterase domain-containing protein
MPKRYLAELQETLESAIPMCAQMGMRVHALGDGGITLRAPLDRNRNHQGTAFAGSLNALCTMAGWANVFLLMRSHGLTGDVVIRRSSIKYLHPVRSQEILARSHQVGDRERDFFLEMLADKGQAKVDVRVEITAADETVVAFNGSYVVSLPGDEPTSRRPIDRAEPAESGDLHNQQ